MKSKPKVNWLARDLVLGPYLALVTSEAEFHAAVAHLKIAARDGIAWLNAGAAATTHTFTNPLNELCCVVAMPRPKRGITLEQVHSLLCHEAVHVFQRFCEDIGEPAPSKEFAAYSVQAIAQRLMTEWRRKRNL